MIARAVAAVPVRWAYVRVAAIGAGLTILTAAGPALHLTYGGWALMGIFLLGGAGAFAVSRIAENADDRGMLMLIFAGAVLMRLSLLFTEPYLSTDIYRYIWDGRVQAAGINPYRYVPAAPELAHLRDQVIFPNINRANTAVTIYPPAAQGAFLALTRLGESVVVMKLGLLAFEAVTVAAVLGLLQHQGSSPVRIAAYAWHPLPVWEIAGSGHVDSAMCALLMLGLLLYVRKQTLTAGVLITLGALVKPTALLALPVFWRPWNWRLPLVVLCTAMLAYLPYLSVGTGVLGYLGGYVDEEGLASGRGIALLWLMERFTGHLPAAAGVYAAAAAIIMCALVLAVAFRSDRSDQTAIRSLCWVLIAFLILASPHYPWYFLVLVPFLALGAPVTAWVLTLLCPLLYDSIGGTGWPDYSFRIALFTLATLAALGRDAFAARQYSQSTLRGTS
jgi:hypothetical protein